jgi:hypothetical protein
MAGLTKEQRAQREAEKLAAQNGAEQKQQQEQQQEQQQVLSWWSWCVTPQSSLAAR